MRGYLKKKHSTKAERVFAEELKRHKIPYQSKVMVNGYEVDFLINEYAIEINGHPQDYEKNRLLLEAGLIPVNYTNKEVLTNRNIITLKYVTEKRNAIGCS